jgi:hypothetical protein
VLVVAPTKALGVALAVRLMEFCVVFVARPWLLLDHWRTTFVALSNLHSPLRLPLLPLAPRNDSRVFPVSGKVRILDEEQHVMKALHFIQSFES